MTSPELMTSEVGQKQQLQCSNLNCRHNVPSAPASAATTTTSTSNKRVFCLCGNVMTVTPREEPPPAGLIGLRHGEKPFILVDSASSEETSLVTSNKIPGH
jgi:hypothetical protein